MPGFVENILQTLQQDPNLSNALIQFGGQLTQPMAPSQTSVGNFTSALANSSEYLRKLREGEATAKLKERQVSATEQTAAATQQQADTGTAAEKRQEEKLQKVDIPEAQATNEYRRAYAEYLRVKANQEKLTLEMLKRTKTQNFDKELWAASITLTGDPTTFKSQDEFMMRALLNYNRMAAAYNRPFIPPPLENIQDENIVATTSNPAGEQEFIKLYGEAGRRRLISARQKVAAQLEKRQPTGRTTAAQPQQQQPGFIDTGATGGEGIPGILKKVGEAVKPKGGKIATDAGPMSATYGETVTIDGTDYVVQSVSQGVAQLRELKTGTIRSYKLFEK